MLTPTAPSALLVPDWPAPGSVRALVTTRLLPGNSKPPFDACNLGLRSGEDPEIVHANRSMLERALGLPAPPRWLRQVHGTGVACLDEQDVGDGSRGPEQEVEADAAVTRSRGIVLAILTADCLPIMLCADDGSEIAALHAGWRGLAAGVIERCVANLRTPRHRIVGWLGPAIGPDSYEVGTEVREAFLASDLQAEGAFEPTRSGHWLCDLYRLARQRLRTLGVERIGGGGFDVFNDARFYSHRRDGAHSGRFATLAWIAGPARAASADAPA